MPTLPGSRGSRTFGAFVSVSWMRISRGTRVKLAAHRTPREVRRRATAGRRAACVGEHRRNPEDPVGLLSLQATVDVVVEGDLPAVRSRLRVAELVPELPVAPNLEVPVVVRKVPPRA